jgi:hypothetical protein
MTFTIYCIGCGEHAFKLDNDIFRHTPVVELKCPDPDCGKSTRISLGKDGEMIMSEAK